MKPLLLALLLVLPASQAASHHPGERIDEVMAEREHAFEATDLRRMPLLAGTTADAVPLRIIDLNDRIVVVSFAPEGCNGPCIAQQALVRRVQAGVNITPMRDRVIFLTVGPASGEGWDDANWQQLTPEGGADAAAASFAALSGRGGEQPMVHVIDRSGRHAAIIHGADFGQLNLILYINELTNAPPPKRGWRDNILDMFR